MLMEIQTGNTFQTEAQAGACRATTVHAPQDLKETSATFSQKHNDMFCFFFLPPDHGRSDAYHLKSVTYLGSSSTQLPES